MGSLAERGMGTILEKTSTHAPIAELTEIGEFGVTRADLEVTNHDSSGNAEEYIAGLIASGEITVNGNLITGDTSGQMQAITDCLAGTTTNWTIRLPNSDLSTFTFYGYCKSFKFKAPVKDKLGITLTFKINRGAPAWTV